MPSEQKLARMFKINHGTVRRGLQELRDQGAIETRPRIGNFIKHAAPTATKTQIAIIMRRRMLDRPTQHPVAMLTMAQLRRTLDHKRYSLSMLSYDCEDLWHHAGSVAVANQVKGVLLFPVDSPRLIPAIERMLEAGIKIVLASHPQTWDRMGLYSIKLDTDGALEQIFKKLVDLGHRRIAVLLDTAWPKPFYEQCRQKVESLFAVYDLGPLEDMLIHPPADPQTHERDCSCLESLLEGARPATAVIVPDENFATGVFRFCYSRGIRIPQDLSLASTQDYTPHSHPLRLSAPPSGPLLTYGVKAAAQHLVQLVEGRKPMDKDASLRCDMNWTDSVGPVPTATLNEAPTN